MDRIAVIMTCFNRINKTEKCIKSIASNLNYKFDFYITDDNSNDGTFEMLEDFKKSYYGVVKIIRGNGRLFWCKGMKKAFDEAIRNKYNYYLWVNDDVEFYSNFIDKLLKVHNEKKSKDGIIIVGSCRDKNTNKFTYGGVNNIGNREKLRYKFIPPTNEIQECDTFNGNCTLIDKYAVNKVGSLDNEYEHGMGDFDYGHRAKDSGIKVYIAPGYIGTCSRNIIHNTWKDTNLSLKRRWELVKRPNGLPIKSWKKYTKRFGGKLWVINFVKPYLKILLTSNFIFRK